LKKPAAGKFVQHKPLTFCNLSSWFSASLLFFALTDSHWSFSQFEVFKKISHILLNIKIK
jgi:hypothetical protein